MKLRCVVTGIDRRGKAVVLSDGEPRDQLEMGGFQMADAWSTSGELAVGPDADSRSPWQMAALPAPGGTVLRYAVIPPPSQQATALQQLHEGRTGDFEVEHDDPSMHTTDSVDCGFVLSGEIGLELDDGVITWMQPGDCFIQQGTRHAWRNRGEVPAVIGVVMLGARRRDSSLVPDSSAHALHSRSLTATLARSGGELARRHEALWKAVWQQGHVPAPILELCRLLLAQLHGATRELEASPPPDPHARVDSGKISSVLRGSWTRESCVSPAERAALGFTEIYAQDPQAITDDLADEVKTHYGEAGLVALIEALGVIDGRIRLGMMLGDLLHPTEAAHE